LNSFLLLTISQTKYAMKNIILIFTLSLFYATNLFSQNQTLNMGDIKAPKIEWEEESFDFGNVKHKNPVDVVFKFKNTGNAPLILSKVEASCGCTDVQYKKAPIMPGQTGELSVTFDAEDMGIFSKSVNVTTNTNPAMTILKFNGEVVK
jgi:hypothetical protein